MKKSRRQTAAQRCGRNGATERLKTLRHAQGVNPALIPPWAYDENGVFMPSLGLHQRADATDYSAEELEWLRAVDAFRRANDGRTPVLRDVLAIAHAAGYRRVLPADPAFTPAGDRGCKANLCVGGGVEKKNPTGGDGSAGGVTPEGHCGGSVP